MMNPKDTKKAVIIALDIIKELDIKDESLRTKTYEVLLKNQLGLKSEETGNLQIIEEQLNLPTENKDTIKDLALKLGCNAEKIEDFFEISNNHITLLCPIKRDSSLEEHILFSLVYLTLTKLCFDMREIGSNDLREMMSMKQISHLTNLSTNIKKFPSLIIHKSGKIGSTKTSYKITHEGVSRGISLIKDLIKEGNVDNLDLGFLGKVTKRKKISSAVPNAILELLEKGFFDKPVSTKEVVFELRKQGIFNRRQDIDAHLRQVLLGVRLFRERINNKWHYVIKK
ncbi:MAG: hypothetical protein Q8L27_04070 [archaeon]|nr:hypothetical protein [archaeon]